MSGHQMTLPSRPAAPGQSSTPTRSPSGTAAASGAAPASGATAGQNPGWPKGTGVDPARMDSKPPLSHEERVGKRVDLPADAYLKNDISSTFATRPGFNTEGQPSNLRVNQFPVTRIANLDVCQYDVALSPEPTHGVVYDKVWNSKKVQQKITSVTKQPWIYDGRKLAWLAHSVDEIRLMVDLDEERGGNRRPGAEKKNVFFITIRPTGKVRLQALKAYLEKKAPWDNSVLECMSFLDHLLRQGASERMTTIKRSFFHPSMPNRDLDMVLTAYKGVYASFRLSQNISSIGLGVNVDVTNQAFWKPNSAAKIMKYLICLYGGLKPVPRFENLDDQQVTGYLRPVYNRSKQQWEPSEAFKAIRRLKGARFTLTHRSGEVKEYKIKGFAFDQKYGAEGGCANKVTFDWRKPDGSVVKTNVRDYMKQRYNVPLLVSGGWPVIETTRAGSFPAEVCKIVDFNQYQFKLDPNQTSQMIRFAVQRPPQRMQDISSSVARLNWGGDKYLKAFGVSISNDMAKTQGRLLKTPEVHYDKKAVRPNNGRWDLRGTRFVEPNREPLTRWGAISLGGRSAAEVPSMKKFMQQFANIYKGHGGKVARDPAFCLKLAGSIATMTDDIHKELSRFVANPNKNENAQIVFIVVSDKSAHVYERLKKTFECRYGIVTQVLLREHVDKAQPQYISNVCMKVNAKLGGVSCALTPKGKSHGFFTGPTMMLGVDVSHAAPGSDVPSIAAMCASVDREGYQYRAAVQTNGWRSEMLTEANIEAMLPPFLSEYFANVKHHVQQIYYFRDGVSEGQFAHVLKQEVEVIKKVCMKVTKSANPPRVTVIVATKRHHIRFFPENGDKNGNCQPGTLVEREVTHPFHYDFYLNSHFALQGTARPVHYHVLMDEIKPQVNTLQRMIYQQCYTFCRSTTPISLHPAVYYAHLAGARGRCHEGTEFSVNPRVPEKTRLEAQNPNGLVGKHQAPSTYSSEYKKTHEPPKLDTLKDVHNTMWWV
ncbi:Piwi domain-containing protein [Sordaria brevicollis]|uniref:Piwi domain-containing protein n=1 Tax=Sordaria brevicollis TaxID=83679 RepID=A0AAE0NRD1_SORBR|nr:Piwi domain-containing protein [Sordaria brevicollis]